MENTSQFKDVKTDYAFTFQITNTLPPKGYLYVKFPTLWGNIIIDTTKPPN